MRKILSVLFLLVFVTMTYGQKIIDTTEKYNGALTHKKIEFDSAGKILKEKYYYNNGNIQTEYFFENGKQIHWISYDKIGNQTAEWYDPGVGYAKKRKLRNIVFSVTLCCISGLVIGGSGLSYTKTFYTVLCLTVIYPFLILLAGRSINSNEQNEIVALIGASAIFILPGILFILSILNFLKKGKIPLLISIFALLISISLLLFFTMTTLLAGAGILA